MNFAKRIVATPADYIGGYNNNNKSSGVLIFYEDFVEYKAVFKHTFKFKYDELKSISVESPEDTSKRVTAGRLVALGVFAFAFKKTVKESFVVMELEDGQEVIFHVKKFDSMTMRAKLSSVKSRLQSNG